MRANVSAMLCASVVMTLAGSVPAAPTITNPVADVVVKRNASNSNIDLLGRYSDPGTSVLRFATNLGNVDVCMFDSAKPITVTNFKNYVNSGAYTGSIIHRGAKYTSPTTQPFVLQGGGFKKPTVDNQTPPSIPANPSIQNEPGISNLRGTIAMAKIGGQPNSATNNFFFNMNDRNATDPTGALLDTTNGGFTVFGRVVNGMSVLDAINNVTTYQAGSFLGNNSLNELPLIAPILSPSVIIRPSDYVTINTITTITGVQTLTYTATSANPTLVTATLNGTILTLAYQPNKSGKTSVSVVAKSQDGTTVTDTFNVAVRCNPSDIADDQGNALPGADNVPNGGVNEGDYNLFFLGFFNAAAYCNIADDQGNPLPAAPGVPNSGVNEGDYNCFFQKFFAPCGS